jgi:formamidopyrimidine-DNA glycosylase
MPELPEVEFGRRLAESVAAGGRVVDVRCARDSIVFEGVSSRRFRIALIGATVLAVRRYGKHLWFETDRRPQPLFHFGMTGAFRVRGVPPLRLASSPSAEHDEWPPRFSKIRITFAGSAELVMVNKRRLGRIRLRDDPAREPPISALGFDPLLALPSVRPFARLLDGRTTNVKGLLLDQRFAAGVGNWIADEVLYQARIDPRRSVDSLDPDEIRRLRNRIAAVIRKAVGVNADKRRFPKAWLFHRRWGKDGTATTADGHAVEHLTVAGRTTAWVPAVQR